MSQFRNKKQLLTVFNYNIQLIYKTYNHLSLTNLADKLNIPCSTLSRLLDEKNEILPQTLTLYRISKSLGLSMDALITEKLNKRQLPENFPFRTYRGINHRIKRYICGRVGEKCQEPFRLYYFNTNTDDSEEMIQEGELQVLSNEENEYLVIAAFGLNLENKKIKHYEGYIVLSGYHVYINLETVGITGERVLIVFYDQISDNNYQGGLGIITSISRGLTRAPCSQKIIISKKTFGQKEKDKILPQFLEFKNTTSILKVTGDQDQEVYRLLQNL
jgi:transcriptional regulator with XRE-family HTH domain